MTVWRDEKRISSSLKPQDSDVGLTLVHLGSYWLNMVWHLLRRTSTLKNNPLTKTWKTFPLIQFYLQFCIYASFMYSAEVLCKIKLLIIAGRNSHNTLETTFCLTSSHVSVVELVHVGHLILLTLDTVMLWECEDTRKLSAFMWSF